MVDLYTGYHEPVAAHHGAYGLPSYDHYANPIVGHDYGHGLSSIETTEELLASHNPHGHGYTTHGLGHLYGHDLAEGHGYTDHGYATHHEVSYSHSASLQLDMMNGAIDNLVLAMRYIRDHPYYHDGPLYMPFFKETAEVLRLSKEHRLSGYVTEKYLLNAEHEMTLIKEDLERRNTEYDHVLAEYLRVAIHETNVARSVESTSLHHNNSENQMEVADADEGSVSTQIPIDGYSWPSTLEFKKPLKDRDLLTMLGAYDPILPKTNG